MNHSVDQSETVFRNLLTISGLDDLSRNEFGVWATSKPDSQTVWTLFREFSCISFTAENCQEDGLLFEWALDQSDKSIECVSIGMTRQWSFFTTDGEYDRMEHCYFQLLYKEYGISDELTLGNFWSHQFKALEQFWDAAEQTDAFSRAMQEQALRLEMAYGRV